MSRNTRQFVESWWLASSIALVACSVRGELGARCERDTSTSSACYSGAPSTRSKGECRDGIRGCDGGLCEHERLPVPELCGNQLDDDCNGETDDTCPCENVNATRCAGVCVDLQSSSMHCGQCNHACAGTDACTAGKCGNEAEQLVAGLAHTCAVLHNGLVYCWGDNLRGQLGDQSTATRASAVRVAGLVDVIGVATYGLHTCALRRGGEVWCWGDNSSGQVGTGTISLLGELTPRRVMGLDPAVGLSVGNSFSCVRTMNNDLSCWGGSTMGEQGLVSPDPVLRPTLLSSVHGVQRLESGASASCILTAGRTVECWGNNTTGVLGRGSFTGAEPLPRAVSLLGDVIQVGMGSAHACALDDVGSVKCWGHNLMGQLGDGTLANRALAAPIQLQNARQISVSPGGEFTCAVDQVRDVYCWGTNLCGLISSSGDGAIRIPTRVVLPDAARVVEAGYSHACAIVNEGRVVCWGCGESGQLGIGLIGNRTRPTEVVGLP